MYAAAVKPNHHRFPVAAAVSAVPRRGAQAVSPCGAPVDGYARLDGCGHTGLKPVARRPRATAGEVRRPPPQIAGRGKGVPTTLHTGPGRSQCHGSVRYVSTTCLSCHRSDVRAGAVSTAGGTAGQCGGGRFLGRRLISSRAVRWCWLRVTGCPAPRRAPHRRRPARGRLRAPHSFEQIARRPPGGPTPSRPRIGHRLLGCKSELLPDRDGIDVGRGTRSPRRSRCSAASMDALRPSWVHSCRGFSGRR